MIKQDFRTPERTDLKEGMAVWLEGKGFDNTNLSMYDNPVGQVAGPFLVERILFETQPEPRVDILDPDSGQRRSFMCSWLLVPKEDDNVR